MARAQLGEQCVNGAHLDTRLATSVAQGCRSDVVISVWLKQRQSGKAFDDLGLRFGAREALQELLKDQTGGDDHL